MQLNLTAEEEAFIEEKVADGYESRESVVSAALALMREADARYSAWFREQVELGLKDLDEGRWVEATPELREEIKRRGRERLAELRKNSA
ncbi:MAG: type II toxin-antitoxin system ParD family antitoxin [Tepidiformaceae bacterium]